MVVEQVVSGLALGCIYALVAVGFSLIFAAFALPHFAQGDVLMLGGVVGLEIARRTNLGIVPTLAVTGLVVGLAGAVLERAVYRPMVDQSLSSKIICTVNVGILLQNLVAVLWGPRPHAFPPERFGGVSVTLLGRTFPPTYSSIIISTALLMVGLTLLLNRTKLGLGMRATAYSHMLAGLMGVNVGRTLLTTFVVGSALAGIAGILLGELILVHFQMGVTIGLKGYVAAVIGGFGNIPGAVVGGLLLGVVENLACAFVSSQYKDCIAFVLLILMLVAKPRGLLGRKEEVKV